MSNEAGTSPKISGYEALITLTRGEYPKEDAEPLTFSVLRGEEETTATIIGAHPVTLEGPGNGRSPMGKTAISATVEVGGEVQTGTLRFGISAMDEFAPTFTPDVPEEAS